MPTIIYVQPSDLIDGKPSPDLQEKINGLDEDSYIDFSFCKDALTSLADVNFGNTIVLLEGCFNLTSLEGATFNNQLNLSNCPKLTTLKGVNINSSIVIDGCNGITDLDELTIQEARIVNCKGLTSINNSTFEKAEIQDCNFLKEICDTTFTHWLSIWKCNSLEIIHRVTSNGESILGGLAELKSIEKTTFAKVTIAGCPHLKSIADCTFNGNTLISRMGGGFFNPEGEAIKRSIFNQEVIIESCINLGLLEDVTFNGCVKIFSNGLGTFNRVTFKGRTTIEGCSLASFVKVVFGGLTELDNCSWEGDLSMQDPTFLEDLTVTSKLGFDMQRVCFKGTTVSESLLGGYSTLLTCARVEDPTVITSEEAAKLLSKDADAPIMHRLDKASTPPRASPTLVASL